MFLWLIFGSILCFLWFSFLAFMVLFYDWRWIKDRHRYAKLPLPKYDFLVGAGFDLTRYKDEELFEYLEKKKQEVNSDLILLPILGRTCVVLFSPDDIEEVFKSFEHLTKGYEYLFVKPLFGNNVTLKTGHDWLKRRKLLTPAYHNNFLQNHLSVFNKNAKLLTKVLANQSRLKGCVEIEEYFLRSTLDTIIETTVGVRLNCLEEETPEYVAAIQKMGDLITKRTLTFWMQNETLFNLSSTGREFNRAMKLIHSFCAQAVTDGKKFYNDYERHGLEQTKDIAKSRKSFLDYLLYVQRENPTELSDEDLLNEVRTVLFAGNETVALTLIFAVFMLATNPDVQEKVREEIDSVFDGSDRDITMEDLNQLNYMEMVISETLRLCPIFPLISRYLVTDLKLKKYTVPAGTNVLVIPHTIHRNPDLFPDPHKFDPDRFLPEAVRERHRYAFLGWSAGYRNCMGKKFGTWQMKIVLATIIRSLTVSSELKQEDLRLSPQMSLKPAISINLTFKPIST